MATLEQQASKLLDFNQKLDINLLDNIVGCLYSAVGDQQRVAQDILTALKEHPDAWTRVDTILEYSQNQETKYYALQILEQVILTRWKILPRNQCEGIKKYIVGLIIKNSSDPVTMESNKVYLKKLNMILIQVLKREWPHNWETFISDIVGASKTNESLCQNNMEIFKLLSEEVFMFSTGQLTQTKAKHLKDTMCSEFSQIFQLCQFVLENSQNAPLVGVTLDTLLRFLNWIPLGYIFEMKLISTLIFKFLNVPMFRNVTLSCLTEIAGVTVSNYDQQFVYLFVQTMEQLEVMLPLTTNIREAYVAGRDQEQVFIQNLALFLCTYLKEHGPLIEKSGLTNTLMNGLRYLVLISEVEDVEIFKICLEYWNALAADLYKIAPCSSNLYHLGKSGGRKALYADVLSSVRYIMISRMAKPEEVLVVENENGEVVREFMKDTDSINLYKNMRETLVYLTHLDYLDTERIMTEKLQNQVNGTEWSWKNLNTLCWAIGSISGALSEDDEKRFLVIVIKELLGLCEQKKGKDNKAIIASNIMYVVGQYPRFLRAHWKFLKTVVNKLFEFMHETHDGVQDMACDTFIKIAIKCRRHFVTTQVGEACPFIEEILGTISTIICDLQTLQVHTFYEAVGYMISAQVDQVAQELLIEKYMLLPNQVWDDIISQASRNVEILKDPEAVKQLVSILKTNVRACRALAHPYVVQLGRIYLDMLNVYKVMSENISQAIALNGVAVTKQPLIKNMRIIKKETLNLISSWVTRSIDNSMVLENFIPPLLDAVLLDYQRTAVPEAREPEVLSCMAAIVHRLEGHITSEVPKIFDAVFECTLEMINKDFEEYPEHRTEFFLLLQAVNTNCFKAFLSIPPAQFKLVLDSIIWAFKHTMRNVADTGLQILYRLLLNVEEHPQAAQSFYRTYLCDILEHVFSVVTDTSHGAGLTMHATILAHIFSLVEAGRVTVPLGPTPDNVLYIQVPRESFKHIVKACECPLYWKMPLFLATQQNLHLPIDGHKFIDFWREMTSQCHDQASRFVYILTRGKSSILTPEDFVPLVQDVVDTHPGLSFLKEATEFHSRYVHTVIARIFYCVNRSWSGRISIPELRRSNLLQIIQLLEDEEDINQVTQYFSYEHFYVIYCKFWELDRDHDLFIDRHDLARHNDHALSSRMIERVLSGCVTRGNQNRLTPDGEPRMSYTEFVWFLLAEEDKTHPTAIEYWFRCMDIDGDGYISMYELEYFYEEQMQRMEAIGIETLPFNDCLCQMLDMVHPAETGKITLSDLKKCKLTPIFFDTFFNLEKYLDHEQRDPFATQRDSDCEMSEWDRFAAEEYELLVAEEGGSEAQEQISYDETDEDCLSPNMEDITNTEVVEDSSVEESTLSEGGPLAPGYVNLSSIYSLGTERWKQQNATLNNGLAEKRLPEKPVPPEKPVSLMMVNGKMDNRYSGFSNNSFLYSQLLGSSGVRTRDPPSYSVATGGLDVDTRNAVSPVRSPATSPVNGINKISDNYERAIAERLSPQRDISRVNRSGLFSKVNTGIVANNVKKNSPRRDEEDGDYARDSDECSI